MILYLFIWILTLTGPISSCFAILVRGIKFVLGREYLSNKVLLRMEFKAALNLPIWPYLSQCQLSGIERKTSTVLGLCDNSETEVTEVKHWVNVKTEGDSRSNVTKSVLRHWVDRLVLWIMYRSHQCSSLMKSWWMLLICQLKVMLRELLALQLDNDSSWFHVALVSVDSSVVWGNLWWLWFILKTIWKDGSEG